MIKKGLTALIPGLSLALVSSVALAAPSADTLLVAGYDSDQMAVLYGVSSIDQEGDGAATLDCSLVGTFEYTIGEKEEGIADVDSLALAEGEDDDPVDTTDDTTFEAETVVDDPDAPADITYDDLYAATEDDGKDCLLTSVDIEPNGDGEINHGMVVSTFAKLLQGGNGCLIRHFAQSDFGKGDYDDVDAGTFEVTLESFETACSKKAKGESVDDEDDSRGKANAPGQNKAKPNKGKADAPGQLKKAQGDDSSSD